MSQYYQSNRPYNSAHEQKDGVSNGAIIGGLAGAGAMAGVQFGGGVKAINMYGGRGVAKTRDALKKTRAEGAASLDDASKQKIFDSYVKGREQVGKAKELRGKFNDTIGKKGNWKSRALAYGGSALAGMAAGAGMDAMNN